MKYYINSRHHNCISTIAHSLQKCLVSCDFAWESLVFLCIGTDKIIGDCLGPYIGELLTHSNKKNYYVYGTFNSPIHALNLTYADQYIKQTHPNSLIIAIDAALGQKKHLEYITIGNGSIYPGAGVLKELPPVGDIYITGIVNSAEHFKYLALQTTSLSTIISMGNKIAHGILDAIP